MPMRRAASITSVPGGTVTSRSSIFRVISFESAIFVPGSSTHACQHVGWLKGTLAGKMLFEFVSPFLHDTDCRHGGGVSQRAKRFAEHVFRQFANHRNVFGPRAAGVETIEHFAQPARAFPAGNTPAAGLVRVKVHD